MIVWLLKKWVEHLGMEAAKARHRANMAMRARDGGRYAGSFSEFHQAFQRFKKWQAIRDDHLMRRRIRKCR